MGHHFRLSRVDFGFRQNLPVIYAMPPRMDGRLVGGVNELASSKATTSEGKETSNICRQRDALDARPCGWSLCIRKSLGESQAASVNSAMTKTGSWAVSVHCRENVSG